MIISQERLTKGIYTNTTHNLGQDYGYVIRLQQHFLIEKLLWYSLKQYSKEANIIHKQITILLI